MSLSILCVTKGEPHAAKFLRSMWSLAEEIGAQWVPLLDGRDVHSGGYIESVLDEAVSRCSGDYVLRLDDDEACSVAMERWLSAREYEAADNWKFRRVHLWSDQMHALVTPHLYPDHQTRLAIKAKAGGRSVIHSGSPHGGGIEAPCAIEHSKFLVKTLEERRAIVARYDSIQSNAGTAFRAFSCPEDVYSGQEIAASIIPWDGHAFERRAA